MENLIYDAKIAVIKILSEIMNADDIIHEKEIEFLNATIASFKLNDCYISDLKKMMTLNALSIISKLPDNQKNEIAKMMGNMIVVDKDINYNEVNMYNIFCKSCDIENNFKIEDYPEFSLSGPFVNPEDIMNGI